MKLPATLVCVVIASTGCETKQPGPVDATVADAAVCELFCVPVNNDAGITCMGGCADAGAICPAGCRPVG